MCLCVLAIRGRLTRGDNLVAIVSFPESPSRSARIDGISWRRKTKMGAVLAIELLATNRFGMGILHPDDLASFSAVLFLWGSSGKTRDVYKMLQILERRQTVHIMITCLNHNDPLDLSFTDLTRERFEVMPRDRAVLGWNL
uniref:DUF4470 domain-containing protein n=1 Tax=Steinernema glaseri TaxID=37863 RepID=A0A1I7Y3F3_9BILA